MNEENLKELRELLASASSELDLIEGTMRSLSQKESRIMELLEGEVSYPRSFRRESEALGVMSRRVREHNFLRKVSRLIPDFEREARSDRELSHEVRDELEDALVQVGDTQMTLGTLLRALEREE